MIKAPWIKLGQRILELPVSKSNEGFYVPILAKADEQVGAMLSHHCKVLVFRLDLHVYEPSDNNMVISTFIRQYRQRLKRSLELNRLGFLWCRERHKSDKQHYHVTFMVDGNKHQHPSLLIDIAKMYWDERDTGTIYTPKQCYQLLRRGDEEAYQRVFEHLSYLAKVFSKGSKAAATNDYEGSRVKLKEFTFIA